MQRFCLTLDLRPDPQLIAEYIELHRLGRPEINQSIREAGVLSMQIYELDGRLFMIMDTTDDFSFERKARMDLANSAVQQWEQLMAKFQDVAADSDPHNRWRPMKRVYDLVSTFEAA